MSFYAEYPVKGGAGNGQIYPNVGAFPLNPPEGTIVVDSSNGDIYEFTGGQYVLIAGPQFSNNKANVTLNNLSNVAINTSLLPATDGSIDLGSAADNWRDIHVSGAITSPGDLSVGAQGGVIVLAVNDSLFLGAGTNVILSAGSGMIDASSATIVNLTDPVDPQDGATKNYVDTAIINLGAITALTGDGTATGPGSAAFTLATVNSNIGSFGSASSVAAFTVNGKGLTTAASAIPILITESQVTNLVTDLAGKQPTGNYITALTGDATAAGPGSAALTLATVNANVGAFGSASSVATFTVNAKGLTTAASAISIQIAESQVTNLTSDLALKAPLASPALTGTPTAPTATAGTNTTQLATTAFVTTAVSAGGGITALTGDATATGPGSVALTLATVNANVGSFGSASSVMTQTVNAKGLTTAAASVPIQITESQVTNLVSDLAGKQPTGNYITALTGDATASGPGSATLTLASVAGNTGTFGTASNVGQFTVNTKGLVTAAANVPIQITESQVTNLTSDLALKAPLASPALTGTPTAPTAAIGTNTTQLATTAFVQASRVKGRVNKGTAQTFTTSVQAKVTFGSVSETPVGIIWDATNNRFTCTIANTFFFETAVLYSTTGAYTGLCTIKLNNTTDLAEGRDSVSAGNNANPSTRTQITLAVNDFIEVFSLQNSGGNLDILATPTYNYFIVSN